MNESDLQLTSNTIVLDEDLRDVFPDSDSVNHALREYQSLMTPKPRLSSEEFVKRINETYAEELQEETRLEARRFSSVAM
ncbi:MAG: hypothetical protein H7308_09510 [Chthonomonadaceae bacterium]|nr:hypothetical protein [Chthonomonadaceae bacterium]